MYTVNSLIFDDCTLRDWGLISEIYHHILCLGQSLQTRTDWILSKCQYDLVLTSSLHAEYEVRVRTQHRLIEHHSKSVKWPFTLTPCVLSKNTLSSPTQLKTLSTSWQNRGSDNIKSWGKLIKSNLACILFPSGCFNQKISKVILSSIPVCPRKIAQGWVYAQYPSQAPFSKAFQRLLLQEKWGQLAWSH